MAAGVPVPPLVQQVHMAAVPRQIPHAQTQVPMNMNGPPQVMHPMAHGAASASGQKPASAVENVTNSSSADQVQVGPLIDGGSEQFNLEKELQHALFGAVYEARGQETGKEFAIKVLHKSELARVTNADKLTFCETPLGELKFDAQMRKVPHVLCYNEHFETAHCHFIVFELARGGDLLERLKHQPRGFSESDGRFFLRQAIQGIAGLHKNRLAMQDVSLENLLMFINPESAEGVFDIKLIDPGQATLFELDQSNNEIMVNFEGLVGKSFRPPELYDQKPYLATKLDSFCLGWSTFYLLTAQSLFQTADPQDEDNDWLKKKIKFHEFEHFRVITSRGTLISWFRSRFSSLEISNSKISN